MSVAQHARMRGKRGRSQRESRYCYESPLKVFKTSLEELTSIVGDIVYKKQARGSTRRMAKRLHEQNTMGTSSKESSSPNNVIVINDSDSETIDGDNDDETNARDEKDTSLSVIECISKPSSSPWQERNSRIPAEQNTNRLSIIPLNNDSSVLHLSDTQESLLNGENIAPTQMDDVVELWSCLKESNENKKKKKDAKCNHDGMKTMFMIDKRPNLKYLRCLRTDTKYADERKNKQDLSYNKTTSKLFIKPVKQTSKCSNNSKKKKWCKNNLDSSPVKSYACHSKGQKINSNEKSSQTNSTHKLREIVVDGCNVAMAHTNGQEFSERGIQIVVDYFKLRGHIVKVFLPQHVRKREHLFLEQLYKEGTVVFTPSRTIDGRQITSYDDRYILKYATSCGGVVISTDQYRDLYKEKPEWRNTILNRLLIPTFVGDYLMFPEDPLGRFGPNLETFLRH